MIGLPNPIRIAVITTTPGSLDVVHTYHISTNIGIITILVYDNLIPLNVHAIISEQPMEYNKDILTIIDEDVKLNNHIESIVRTLSDRNDVVID